MPLTVKVALEKAKTAAEPTPPRTPRQSRRQGRQTIQVVPMPVIQPVQIVEKATGSSEDDHRQQLEQSCVERSERVLADKANANSSTEERKVRQQVEQRRQERKQLKVQNWRGDR